jgi:hypothetical protein
MGTITPAKVFTIFSTTPAILEVVLLYFLDMKTEVEK